MGRLTERYPMNSVGCRWEGLNSSIFHNYLISIQSLLWRKYFFDLNGLYMLQKRSEKCMSSSDSWEIIFKTVKNSKTVVALGGMSFLSWNSMLIFKNIKFTYLIYDVKIRERKKTECVIILAAFWQKRKFVYQVSLARLTYS